MSDVTYDAEPEEYEDDDSRRPSTPGPSSAEASGGVDDSSLQPENQEDAENLMRLKLKSMKLSDDINNDDFDHDEYTQYDDWFPSDLRKKLDIAIIHDDADDDEARNLKYLIEKNVQLTIGGKRFRPTVELLKHLTPSMQVDPIDYALKEAAYLFVYVTHNFLKNEWCKYESRSSVKAILSRDKGCSLVCVHTDKSSSNRLGANLNNAKQLHYCEEKQEQFIQDVRTYFYQISNILLKKKSELTQRRKQYFDENLAHLRKKESSSNKSNFSQRKTNVAGIDKSSQNDQEYQQRASLKDKHTGTVKQTAPAIVVDRESGTHRCITLKLLKTIL